MKILFVCLGNICRSPLAQAIAEFYGRGHFFDSAGTSDFHQGSPPCEGSIKIAQKHNLSLAHIRSRQIQFPQDNSFDLLIALDSQNLQDLLELGFAQEKVRKLGEFGFDGLDVPDPYYYTEMEGFEKVYTMIETCIKNLLEEIDHESLGY